MIIRNWARKLVLRRPADDETTTGGVGTNNDARVAMLNSIGDNLDEERASELANVNDDDTTEPFSVEKTEKEDTQSDDETTPADGTSSSEEDPPAAQKFKIKVNGQELELTQEELIARAQKVESADRYLADAAEARRRAEAAAPAPPPAATKPTAEELQRQQDEEDRALVRAIQMGTEEEAAAALRKLREQSNARPSITQDDVSRVIDERLTFTKAVEKFHADFQDIVADPILYKLVLSRDQELLEQGDARSYSERYTEIGNEMREWKKKLAPPASDAPAPSPAPNRQERKAAAPTPPKSAGAKTTPPEPEDEGEESPQEVIAKMRQQRGGPQWMRG